VRVLVVGAAGYIGEKFAEYTRGAADEMLVDIVDSYRGWKKVDFAPYDSVLFAAGIAHRKQNLVNKPLYFKVNRDLAVKVAKKAKDAKVPQFIYLSSMAVYGKKEGKISEHSKPMPRHNDYYGQSKLQAEQELKTLAKGSDFGLAIIRPPMVYGAGCPGRFQTLKKLSKFFPIVPDNRNKRSMIYINKLSEFLCMVIKQKKEGVFCPQDEKYVSTAALIRQFRRENGKATLVLPCLGWLVNLGKKICPALSTAYGTLVYERKVKTEGEFG